MKLWLLRCIDRFWLPIQKKPLIHKTPIMSDPVKTLISSLIKEGKVLANLLLKAKNPPKNKESNSTTAEQERLTKVIEIIPNILKIVETFQPPPSFSEKIIPKVLNKIQATLQEFIKLDPVNAPHYEVLLKSVTDCKPRMQTSAVGLSSFPSSVQLHKESPRGDSTQLEAAITDSQQEEQFSSLSKQEQDCLSCFCLFTAGQEVKKREPIHLWIGMGLIDDHLEGAEMLARLVAEGFIERSIGNKKMFNRYKMNKAVHIMVKKKMNINIILENILCIMELQPPQPPQQQDQPLQQEPPPPPQQQQEEQPLPQQQQELQQPQGQQQEPHLQQPQQKQEAPPQQQPPQAQQQEPHQQQQQEAPPPQQPPPQPLPQNQQPQQQHQPATSQPQIRTFNKSPTFKSLSNLFRKNQDLKDVSGTLVLNISEDILQAKTFERISKKKSNAKVIHLGSWHHSSKRYIVVEEIEVLEALTKHVGHLTFLSLQGISGIVELPKLVYKLENLKVLDLRACPNLESLSYGIESLKNLTHLDLSECYLLDHIPNGIASLVKLRVLKGFVVNPEESSQDWNVKEKDNRNGKNAVSCASFSDLSSLKELIKLTIRTRRKSFPTSNDFDTLFQMNNLASIRIVWVQQSPHDELRSDVLGKFPKSLKKLELQAAPEDTMSQLLNVVREDEESSLEKLYIRGGRLWDLGREMHCFDHVQIVRLRYLPELRIEWDEFRKLFPKLSRLEVSGCHNLIFFPCDENGVWEETEY